MPLWKLTLSYVGTTFHGWQVQPDRPTVQGTLAAAIYRLTGERVLPQGSGRTDAGVHALAQVASFSLGCSIPATNLHRALNRLLPRSIRVLAAEVVEPPFHARHSAVRKTYEYRIFPMAMISPADGSPELRSSGADTGEATADPISSTHRISPPGRISRICSPMLAPYVWDYPLPLDFAALDRAAAHILGRHDFTSFAAAGPELSGEPLTDTVAGYPSTPPTPCRIIDESTWSWAQDLLVYRITGSGFLHHMVRNLVGTFVQAGAGRSSPEQIPSILAARSRSAAGPTAPARGLFLIHVEYP